jgi:predicted  nucleic acid-binding Zn-ribbon protein
MNKEFDRFEEHMANEDAKVEKIFELNQEIIRLRGQITYLQEELSSVEDNLDKSRTAYEKRIEDLEQQLGDALYGSKK